MDSVPEESSALKGKGELFFPQYYATTGFLTLCRDKIMLYNPTPVSHSLHGVADGNTNCAHGTVRSRVINTAQVL